MKVNLPGMMNECIRALNSGHGNGGLGYMLECLRDHLRELREDPARLQEFFDLYRDDSIHPAAHGSCKGAQAGVRAHEVRLPSEARSGTPEARGPQDAPKP